MTLREALNIAYERGLLHLPSATDELIKAVNKKKNKK